MASHEPSAEASFDEMVATVFPDATRSDLWSFAMANVHDVMTADCKTYKQGAFSALIQPSDSAPKIFSVYLESARVTDVEKDVFLDAIEGFIMCNLEYKMGKPIQLITDKLLNTVINPLVELFKADMLTASGVYVPRSLVARRMYWADLHAGTISVKDCELASSYPTKSSADHPVLAASEAGLQPPDDVPKEVLDWLEKCETKNTADTKDELGKL